MDVDGVIHRENTEDFFSLLEADLAGDSKPQPQPPPPLPLPQPAAAATVSAQDPTVLKALEMASKREYHSQKTGESEDEASSSSSSDPDEDSDE